MKFTDFVKTTNEIIEDKLKQFHMSSMEYYAKDEMMVIHVTFYTQSFKKKAFNFMYYDGHSIPLDLLFKNYIQNMVIDKLEENE